MLAGEYNDLFADWTDSLIYNPLFEWNRFARLAAARAQSLYDNSPIVHAMVNTKLLGTHGADGLKFRSKFLEEADKDPDAAQSVGDERTAATIEGLLERALPWSDAGAQLSWQELDWNLDQHATVLGDGFMVRCWQDDRNAPLATCWRLIHPARVSNPQNEPNRLGLIDGIELDSEGRPQRLWVADDTKTPYSIYSTYGMWSSSMKWDSYEWFAPDGTPNVIHRRGLQRPIGLRGMTCLMPLVLAARMLEMTDQAFVVNKRVQSQHPFFFKVADIKAAMETYKGSKMANLFLDKEVEVDRNDFEFKGEDYGTYQETVVRSMSASWLFPWELVLGDHSAKSGASSRSLWQQYRLVIKKLRREHAWQCSRPRDTAIIREMQARGEPGTEALGDDWQENMAGRYEGPAIPMPDPLKEAQAAEIHKRLNVSDSSIHRELGFDHRDETLQLKNDRNLSIQILGTTDPNAPVPAPAAGAAPAAPGQPAQPGAAPAPGASTAPGTDGQGKGTSSGLPTDQIAATDRLSPIEIIIAPVPYLAGASADGTKVYIDPNVPKTMVVQGQTIDVYGALEIHEMTEYHCMTDKAILADYDAAHQIALIAEHMHLSMEYGLDETGITDYEDQLAAVGKIAAAGPAAPADIYKGPYKAEGGKESMSGHRCGHAHGPGGKDTSADGNCGDEKGSDK